MLCSWHIMQLCCAVGQSALVQGVLYNAVVEHGVIFPVQGRDPGTRLVCVHAHVTGYVLISVPCPDQNRERPA